MILMYPYKKNMKQNPLINKDISDEVAWRAIQHLVQKFNFDQEEGRRLMGDMPHSSYYKGLGQHNVRLSRDQKERISYLLGIYKALRILFTDSQQAMTWINRSNALAPFNGLTPRNYMLEGSLVRLAEVRRFLDFWRG